MARLLCKCGNTLSNSNQPEIIHYVYSDSEWIILADDVSTGKYGKRDTMSIPDNEYWECNNCGRLIFFHPNTLTIKAIYKLEETHDLK